MSWPAREMLEILLLLLAKGSVWLALCGLAAGLQKLGPVVERLALAEGLAAHQRAVRVRLDKISR